MQFQAVFKLILHRMNIFGHIRANRIPVYGTLQRIANVKLA